MNSFYDDLATERFGKALADLNSFQRKTLISELETKADAMEAHGKELRQYTAEQNGSIRLLDDPTESPAEQKGGK